MNWPDLDDVPLAKSKAELIRTCFSAVAACASLGSLMILVAVHLL